MKSHLTELAAAALLSLLAPFAGAETFSTTTYMQAVFAASPDLEAAQNSLESAKNSYANSMINGYLPSMSLSAATPLWAYNGTRWDGLRLNRNEITSSAQINWNIYNMGKDSLSLRGASISRDIAELSYKSTKQNEAMTALTNYYNLLTDQKLLDVARRDLTDQEAQYNLSQNLYKDGLQSLTDLLQSETNWRASQMRLTSAEATYQQQLLTFNTQINREPFAPVELTDAANESTSTLAAVQGDFERALRDRFEMQSAEASVRNAEITYRQAVLAQAPVFSVDFNWTKSGLQMFGLPSSSASPNPSYSIGASLSVPLGFFWMAQRNEIKNAAFTRRAASLTLENRRRSIRSSVVSARIALELNSSSLGLSKLKKTIAQQKLRLVEEQYRQGVADSIKLTQAQNDDLAAQQDYTTLLYQLELKRAQYHESVGIPLW